MKKKICITGASGFIGKRLIQRLVTEGFDVNAFVHSKTKLSSKVKVTIGDLENKKDLRKFLHSADIVIHLAAKQVGQEDLLFKANVDTTYLLIEEMLNAQVKHLIYLSTVAVYGDHGEKILNEDDPCYPTTIYGLTKYLGENICKYWESKTHATLTILRPFNVYGEESTKGVIYSMVNNIRNHEPIILYGDGKQKRDFLYVDDVVEAIMLSLSEKKSRIYNLGSGENISLLELINCFKMFSPNEIKVVYKKVENDKPNTITYSIEKAQKLLGWKASISIVEGLKKTFLHE